jgi:hypothetical protein
LLLPFHPAVAAQLLLPLAGLLLFSVLMPPFGQDLAREISALLTRRQLGRHRLRPRKSSGFLILGLRDLAR